MYVPSIFLEFFQSVGRQTNIKKKTYIVFMNRVQLQSLCVCVCVLFYLFNSGLHHYILTNRGPLANRGQFGGPLLVKLYIMQKSC